MAAATGIAVTALRPIAMRSGRQIAERMLDPNQPAFNEQLAKIRARRQGGTPGAPGDAGL